ncbi:MAG TPA: hypothetical protein VIY86_03790, partial [Pirellulaceae bacterium]
MVLQFVIWGVGAWLLACCAAWLGVARRWSVHEAAVAYAPRPPVPWTAQELVVYAIINVFLVLALGAAAQAFFPDLPGQASAIHPVWAGATALAELLGCGLGIVWIASRTRADASDFGWRPSRIRADISLGLVAFVAISFPVL